MSLSFVISFSCIVGIALSLTDEWQICGEKGKIEGTKFIASGSRVMAYGKNIVSKGKVEWKVKYNFNTQCCREIGITSSQYVQDGEYFYSADKNSITWMNGNIFVNGNSIASVQKIDKNDDIVTITLDMDENKIFFHKNDERDKMVTVDIEPNKKYRLCGHLDRDGQSWTIISYKHSHDIIIKDLVSLNDINSVISERLQHLNEQNMNQLKEYTLNELLSLQQQCNGLEKEFKETEQLLVELKQKLIYVQDAVTKEITPDVSNFEQWTAKDIVRYLCLLENGRFQSHSDILLKSFEEQGITGSDLIVIEKNDLFSMGIKNFKDRTEIYNHFQALKTKQNLNSQQQASDQLCKDKNNN